MNSTNAQPKFAGVAGGSASGKTTICHTIKKRLEKAGIKTVVLSADNWYHSNNVNFDCPEAYNWNELAECLQALLTGKQAFHPEYDYKTHQRTGKMIEIPPAQCYLLEGILVLYNPRVLQLLELKVFVDVDSGTRLSRRLRRDLIDRGRDTASVLDQFEKMVKPGYDNYIHPTKVNADIIVPKGANNEVAVNMIVKYLN